MLLACVLLCCVMISTHFVSGLYARYSARASGEASARVAKFDFEYELYDGQSTIDSLVFAIPNEDQTFSVLIHNSSEVALEYTITIENKSKNIPLVFTVDETSVKDKCVITYNIAPNRDNITHMISLDYEDINQAINYMGFVDYITLEIDVKQID